MVAAEVDPERLVFVDEMGVHTSLAPLYGYAPKGERLRLSVPRNRGKNATLLASIGLGGMGETMAVEGSTDRWVFEAYVEHALAPTLEAGRVVIMDNLPAHKPARVRELIEQRGCELIYLPSYSPDLNPIEEAFSKIKGIVRRAGARTKGALLEVLGEALSAVSAQDARGYFEHAGYRPRAQLL
jgi:transposase